MYRFEQRFFHGVQRDTITVPSGATGLILGEYAANINKIENQSRCRVHVGELTADGQDRRVIRLRGTMCQIAKAQGIIFTMVQEWETENKPDSDFKITEAGRAKYKYYDRVPSTANKYKRVKRSKDEKEENKIKLTPQQCDELEDVFSKCTMHDKEANDLRDEDEDEDVDDDVESIDGEIVMENHEVLY